MPRDDYVLIEECTLGEDSPSGQAVHVHVQGAWYWVPYSQVRRVHRTKSEGADSIELARWLAEKLELV